MIGLLPARHDPLSITISDPDRIVDEERFLIVGVSGKGGCWLWFILLETSEFGSSVPDLRPGMKDATVKKSVSKRKAPEMRADYDFSGGVRGKYAEKYERGTNVVLIDAELTDAFPDSKSVNDALRALVAIAARADTRKRA